MTVALVIAAYNAEATIARAVRSALAEPEVSEVIVVDDASTDGTAEAARKCDDGTGRLKVLVQPKNGGPSPARNRAIAESKAPWIGILDADDFILPGRTRGLLAHAEGADFVADDLWQVPDSDIDGPRQSLLGRDIDGAEDVTLLRFVLANISQKGRKRGELGFIKPVMRRAFLERHGIRYQAHMRLGEDYELYARALGSGARMKLVAAQGYVSVTRANSLSAVHSETDLLHLRDCDARLWRDVRLSGEEKKALRRHYLSIDCRLQWRNLILAVKKRDIVAAARTFLRPFPVPFFVAGQLLEQVYLRLVKRRD